MDPDPEVSPLHRALLPLVLVIVGLVAFHPHLNLLTGDTRTYPVHMDEYVHWGFALSIQQSGDADTHNIFAGGGDGEFSLKEDLHERGFHVYLAALQEATGIPWTALFAFAPAIVAMLTALAVYVLARRWGAGLEAALFVAAIPTTLRFLGPGFLVPIAWTMPILVVGLHVLLHTRGFRTYMAIALLSAALWPIHAMGALMLLGFTILVGVASASRPSNAAALIATAAAPALIAFPYYAGRLSGDTTSALLPASLETLRLLSVPIFVLAAVGVLWLCVKRETLPAGIVLGVTLIVGGLVLIRRVDTNEDPFGLYDRTFTLLPLLAAILGGVGLAAIRRILTKPPALRRAVPVLIVLLLVGQSALVAASARGQMEQIYYEVVDEARFAQYERAADLLAGRHKLAVVEGQTMPFTIATGIPTVFVFTPGGEEPPEVIQRFFTGGANDTLFLLQIGASVVVTDREVSNPYLTPITDSVYVLSDDVLARIP